MKPNIKYLSLDELLAAKLHERERLDQRRLDQASDTLAWVMALCVSLTIVLLLVWWQ